LTAEVDAIAATGEVMRTRFAASAEDVGVVGLRQVLLGQIAAQPGQVGHRLDVEERPELRGEETAFDIASAIGDGDDMGVDAFAGFEDQRGVGPQTGRSL
jgi:hypothetical protein